MKKAIIIFTRIPLPGKTKTRMMPALSGRKCAALHTCFLKDIYGACSKTDADVFVDYTPEDADQADILKDIFGRDISYFIQEGDTLGEQMYQGIRSEQIRRAFEVLEERDVVFGKTLDGGYYLVGMKKPWKEAFGLEKYGGSTVFEETLCRLEEKGISVGHTGSLQDMDTPEDLQGYRRRMRMDRAIQETYTGRYLAANSRISVIVPLYNEEKTVEQLQEQLRLLKDLCEIIFVDGESIDHTLEKLSPEFRLIHAKKAGRCR